MFDLSSCALFVCMFFMCLCVCFWFYLSAFGFICLFVFDLSVWVICVCLCLICLFVCKGRMCAACVEYNNRFIRISCLIYKLIQFVFMPPFISRELTNLFFSYLLVFLYCICLSTYSSFSLSTLIFLSTPVFLSVYYVLLSFCMSYCLFVCLPIRLSPCLLCLVVHLHTYPSFCQYIY